MSFERAGLAFSFMKDRANRRNLPTFSIVSVSVYDFLLTLIGYLPVKRAMSSG
ncbi:hypothetical protein PO124_16720 [Bacillus licheniformis]|nr:hypothetical protein [Bacillus licheniformis]